MGKRGQSEIPAVIPIAIFGLLLIAAFYFLPIMKEIVNITEEVGFEANFLARDVAMVINTLYASPGNMIVTYDKNMKWFGLRIKDNVVGIHDETRPITELASYPFLADRHATVNEGSLAPRFAGEKISTNLVEKTKVKPVFARINDGLFMDQGDGSRAYSLHSLDCEVGKHGFKHIIVDAAHGADDGHVYNGRRESELTHVFGSSLELLLSTQIEDVFYTRMQDGRRKSTNDIQAASQKKEVDLIVSIHVGSAFAGKTIKAYYLKNSPKEILEVSKGLGCEILNNLLDVPSLSLEGVALIPLDEAQLIGGEGEGFVPLLRPDVAGLILEIGSLRDEASYAELTSTQTKSQLPGVIQDAIV